jgi:hypothetical protein
MASKFARPRTLAIGFAVYFLVMALIAYWAGVTLGYHYTVDITRWTFTIYLLVGAVFLVAVGLGAVWTGRSLDAKLEKAAARGASDDDVIEEVAVEETVSDDVPPPLAEDPAPAGDHVDRDIDELLVSLQEMEHDVETSDTAEPEEPRPARAARATSRGPMASRADAQRESALRQKRDSVVSYFAGPAVAAIGAIGISAAMLPGSDAFLQSYSDLNTGLLLGLGYSFVGIAAYVAASFLLIVRNK